MEEDDIPELEDVSDLVEKIKLNNPVPIVTKAIDLEQQTKPKEQQHSQNSDVKKSSKEFGGMKKGFLFGGNSSKKTKSVASNTVKKENLSDKASDIISPKNKEEDSLVLDEVQEAMAKDGGPFKNKDWINDDLLTQVSSNEKLNKQLSDPRIAKAISWMQKDPKAAMEYYKNDSEVQLFFKEFYQILGNHFTNLDPQKGDGSANEKNIDVPETREDKAVKDIMENPEIREILMNPEVKHLIELLRNDPGEAQKYLAKSDMKLRADINKLVSAGVLGIQSS